MKKFTLFTTLLFCSFLLNAQWQQLNGPCGGKITCLMVKDQSVFAATADHGVFRSTNNGSSWTSTNNGLVSNDVNSLAFYGTKIYAGSSGGLFVSEDNGNSWRTVIINGNTSMWITAVAVNEQNIFVGTYSGDLLRSTDNGTTWSTSISPTSGIITIAINGSKIFVGTNAETIYRSLNNGGDFESCPFPGRCCQRSFAFIGSTVYMATEGYVYFSVNDGDSWTDIFTGLDVPSVLTLAVRGAKLYAGCIFEMDYYVSSTGGLFVLNDGETSWTNLGMTGYSVYSICFANNRILAGTSPGGVFASDDEGTDWIESGNDLVRLGVTALTWNGSTFFAATREEGVFISQDNGISWKHANNGLVSLIWDFGSGTLATFAVDSQKIFIGYGNEILVSADNGSSWHLLFTAGYQITSLLLSGTDLFAGTNGGGIFKTSDNGDTWTSVNNGLANTNVQSMTVKGTNIYAGTEWGIFVSTDQGASWTVINNGLTYPEIVSMAANSQNLFASGVDSYLLTYQAGIFRSEDNGANWNITGPELQINNYATSLVINQENIIAGMSYSEGQVCFSADNGTTWSVVNSGLPPFSGIQTMMIMDSIIYAAITDLTTYEGSLGVWRRPLSELIAFRIYPDTIVLQKEKGDSKSIAIISSTVWSLAGTLPDWLSINKYTGQGSDNVVFNTTQPNPYDQPRFVSFDIVSAGISRHFTVEQNGKITGIDEMDVKTITLYPNPSSGIFNLETKMQFEKVIVYNSMGRKVVEEQVNYPNIRIDLTSEGKGVYWVKLSGKEGTSFREVVVL